MRLKDIRNQNGEWKVEIGIARSLYVFGLPTVIKFCNEFLSKVSGILYAEEGEWELKQHLAKFALRGIVEQLESCGYVCDGGPLENNEAFMALVELAE